MWYIELNPMEIVGNEVMVRILPVNLNSMMMCNMAMRSHPGRGGPPM